MKALKLFLLSLLIATLTYWGNYLQRGPKLIKEIDPKQPINSLVYKDYFNMYQKIYLLNLYDFKGEDVYASGEVDCSKISRVLKVTDMQNNDIARYCDDIYYKYGNLQFSLDTTLISIKETQISYDLSSFTGKYSKAELVVTTNFKQGHDYEFWLLFIGILISIILFLSSLVVGCVKIYNYLKVR
jgi:hypothetical protein